MLLLSFIPAFAGVSKSNIFVFNRGDAPQTLSLILCINSSEIKSNILCVEKNRFQIDFSSSWPANQYLGQPAWWWTGLSGEVVGLKASTSASALNNNKNIIFVETHDLSGVPAGRNLNGSNFIAVAPDGLTAWNSAREIDEVQEIDTDPDSPTFGTILTRISVPISPDAGPDGEQNGRMRPNDATITPDGRYFIEPDLGGETITIVDLELKQVISQLTLAPLVPGNRVRPFHATTNGNIVLVENLEAPYGTVTVVDILDPFNPVEVKRITQADGLGITPMTNEFTPDGLFAYMIMNGSPSEPGRIDVLNLETLEIENNIELPDNCRPHLGDFSSDGSYFFVNCSGSNKVAVIFTDLQVVVQEIQVGFTPRGLIVR
jgi:hypothetical protein